MSLPNFFYALELTRHSRCLTETRPDCRPSSNDWTLRGVTEPYALQISIAASAVGEREQGGLGLQVLLLSCPVAVLGPLTPATATVNILSQVWWTYPEKEHTPGLHPERAVVAGFVLVFFVCLFYL